MLCEPLSRPHQMSLRALQHDIDSATSVLRSQLDVVKKLIEQTDTSEREQKLQILLPLLDIARLSPVLEGCREYCTTAIGHLEHMFTELEEVDRSQRNAMASNKDQQEAAIAAFTMVTVIFLPLTWLTGVFGMNFIDIRDLEYGQWLYWVVAGPLGLVTRYAGWCLIGSDQLKRLRQRRRSAHDPNEGQHIPAGLNDSNRGPRLAERGLVVRRAGTVDSAYGQGLVEGRRDRWEKGRDRQSIPSRRRRARTTDSIHV